MKTIIQIEDILGTKAKINDVVVEKSLKNNNGFDVTINAIILRKRLKLEKVLEIPVRLKMFFSVPEKFVKVLGLEKTKELLIKNLTTNYGKIAFVNAANVNLEDIQKEDPSVFDFWYGGEKNNLTNKEYQAGIYTVYFFETKSLGINYLSFRTDFFNELENKIKNETDLDIYFYDNEIYLKYNFPFKIAGCQFFNKDNIFTHDIPVFIWDNKQNKFLLNRYDLVFDDSFRFFGLTKENKKKLTIKDIDVFPEDILSKEEIVKCFSEEDIKKAALNKALKNIEEELNTKLKKNIDKLRTILS